jgi:hypothetical protein
MVECLRLLDLFTVNATIVISAGAQAQRQTEMILALLRRPRLLMRRRWTAMPTINNDAVYTDGWD